MSDAHKIAPMDVMAKRIKAFRKSQGLSQAEFGEIAGRVGQTGVSKWENGHNLPDWPQAKRLGKHFGRNWLWFCEVDAPEMPPTDEPPDDAPAPQAPRIPDPLQPHHIQAIAIVSELSPERRMHWLATGEMLLQSQRPGPVALPVAAAAHKPNPKRKNKPISGARGNRAPDGRRSPVFDRRND